VRSLGLESLAEWEEWASSGQRPKDIPSSPRGIYADKWQGTKDFLGIKRRSFEEAREYVWSMNFDSVEEFWTWCAAGEKPGDIATRPDRAYPDEWVGWKDWLGTTNKPQRTRGKEKWRPFEEARGYARILNLRGVKEWQAWAASDERPYDIPKAPASAYKDAGWQDWGDWLGKEWWPFEEAREYVRSLGLGNSTEWSEYCRSGQKPDDIPAAPQVAYGEWRGSADWLGIAGSWTRSNLLAFLEDLRPRLGDLGETELYLILAQGGAMPGLQKALGKSTPQKMRSLRKT